MKKIIYLLFIVSLFISCGYYPNEDYLPGISTTEVINSYQPWNSTNGFGYVELFYSINNESLEYINSCSITITIVCVDTSIYTYNTIVYEVPSKYSLDQFVVINTEFKQYSSIEINITNIKYRGHFN